MTSSPVGLNPVRPFRCSLTAAALLLLVVVPSVRAATGGPDGYGHTWADDADGCPADLGTWGPGLVELTGVPLGDWIGPVPLGFVLPFYGVAATEAWISPHGYLSFSAQPHVADPTALPDPAAPNHLIAAHWVDAATLHVTNVRHEADAGGFHVEWEQWVGPTWSRVSSHLWLHPSGELRMAWQAYDENFGALVGHEDAGGSLGVTLFQRAADGTVLIRDGAFPDPEVNRSACIAPPPAPGVLDCAMSQPIGCGITSGNSPVLVATNAELYGCGTRRWSGNEQVFTLELTELTDVSVTLQAGGRDQAVFLLSACNEFDCLAGGGLTATATTLPPGTYLIVVEAADASQHGAFTLDVVCLPVSEPIACEETFGGTTATGLARLDAHGCLAGDFSGAEAYYLLDFPGVGNIDVSVASATGLSAFLYRAEQALDPAGCLGGGVGGAVLWQPPAGRYAIVVDGPSGSEGNFTIAVRCAPRLVCSPGAGPIGCNESVFGTTVGRSPFVEAYRCSGFRYQGPEAVHEFTNPVRQVVSFILDDTADPRLDLLLLSACDEGTCLEAGDAEISIELDPGTYRIVVDGRGGAAAAYELSTLCGNGLEPSTLSITGAVGECFTETKTAWLTPLIPKADVMFAIDLSGSMGAEVDALRANMQDIVDRLGLVVSDLGFGLMSFVDYPYDGSFNLPCPHSGTMGMPTDYPYLLEQPVTTDAAAIRAAVAALPPATGDIDRPAAYNRMMFEAYSDPAVGWRPGARRLLVVFGDAMPHDCNVLACLGGVATPRAIDLGRDGMPETGDELATLDVLSGLSAAGITLLMLESSGGGQESGVFFLDIWDCWTRSTGGEARALNADGTVPAGIDLAQLIEQLVREQGSLCERLELVASPGYESWLVSATPVLIDFPLPAQVSFSIEVCVPAATPLGIHRFQVQLVCDGGVAAVQDITVTVTTDCGPAVVTPPEDVTICLGETAFLDGSGVSLVNCTAGAEHSWWQGPAQVGSGTTLAVSPAVPTDYELVVSCPSDPTCEYLSAVTVDVHAPPAFGMVAARDLAECNEGIELTWAPALFLDPTAGGSYNVYRSELDCADALTRPPLVSGLIDTSWVDSSTRHGRTYHHVVEAEDARAPSACLPRGAGHGGSVARSCAPAVTEVAIPWTPAGVDATLRGSHDGHDVTMEWSRARALLLDEHAHLLKAVDLPTNVFALVSPEGGRDRSYRERDESSRLQFFDLRIANPCEVESEDEFPPG